MSDFTTVKDIGYCWGCVNEFGAYDNGEHQACKSFIAARVGEGLDSCMTKNIVYFPKESAIHKYTIKQPHCEDCAGVPIKGTSCRAFANARAAEGLPRCSMDMDIIYVEDKTDE